MVKYDYLKLIKLLNSDSFKSYAAKRTLFLSERQNIFKNMVCGKIFKFHCYLWVKNFSRVLEDHFIVNSEKLKIKVHRTFLNSLKIVYLFVMF